MLKLRGRGWQGVRFCVEALTACVLTGVGTMPTTYAQVVADPSGGAHRPTVITTSSGIQQVNITAPSGAGVSQNNYTQFDVPKAGVVLNNASTIVQTQQAGYINGNPNLAAGQSARIILNQVNSNVPSQLRGYVEVAGHAAEVVVANGSGIVVDGGGFINTTRGVLTTGAPQWGANGALTGFNVSGGNIVVQGAGMNAANIDQIDLIARAVQVNAALYAKQLNVVTGANQVDHDTLAATAQTPTSASAGVSIDVSQLGGMYANSIALVGTEAGVGVSNQGVIAAQAGDLTLTTQGKLVLAGQTQSSGAMVLHAGAVDNSGATYAQQALSLSAAGTVANSGMLAALEGVTADTGAFTSTGIVGAGMRADGTFSTSGPAYDLALSATQGISATGTTAASGQLSMQGAQISLAHGNASAGSVFTLHGVGDVDLTSTTIGAGQTLHVDSGGTLTTDQATLSSQGAMQLAGAAISNRQGVVSAASALSVTANGTLDNQGGTLSGSAAAIDAGTLQNSQGTIEANQLGVTTSGDLNNRQGTLKQYSTAAQTVTAGGTLDNSSGTIATNATDLTVSAAALTNDSGSIAHAGTGVLTVSATGAATNLAGTIATNGGLQMQAASVDNDGGTIQSGGDVQLQSTGALHNTGGHILTNGAHGAFTVSAGSIDNSAGYLTNNGDGTSVVSAVNGLVNTGGTIGGHGDLTVSATDLTNTSGATLAGGGVTTLNVSRSVDNAAGEIFGGTSLNAALTGTTFSNAGGTIEGAQTISLALASLGNQGGTIRANSDITASGAMSGAGEMTAGGNLTLNVTGDYTNAASNQLHADGDMTVSSTGTLTNNGTLATSGTLHANAVNIVNAASADIDSNATQVTATGTLTNAGRIEGNTVTTGGGTLSNTGTVIGNQVTVNQDNVVNSGAQAVIAGVQSVAIHAANAVSNTDGALIYSGGNLEIGRDGTRDSAGMLANQTGSVLNRSATISAEGDIDIATRALDNSRTSIVTQAGAPQSTTQNLTLWTADLPIGGPSSKHVSVTFPQWSWNSDQAGISQSMVNALAAPVVVTVPKTQVTNLNTAAMTFTLTSPIIEQFTPTGVSYTATCDADGNCTPDYYTNTLGTNPTQWYQNIVDNGSSYTITFWPDYNPNVNIRPDQVITRNDLGSDSHDYSETARTVTTTTTTDQLISATAAASIAARGSIRINADNGTISNRSSTMAAGGALTRRATNGSVSDTGITLLQTVTQNQVSTFYWHQKTGGSSDTETVQYPLTILPSTTVASLPAIATANGAVQTTAENITVASVGRVGQTVVGSGVTGGNNTGTTLGGVTGTLQTLAGVGIAGLTLPSNGLYSFKTAPGQTYLVATDPRFTNYSTFISSDYMLAQLGLDPQTTEKRVGDGLYEESLVNQQVTALTGKTFLTGYTSNLDEYTALMNNGVTYAKSFDLVPGVALTSAQMQQLTTDMVWLVSQTVTLPDGSQQTVLVPKLYLAQSNTVDLNGTGALVAGNTVSATATGTVTNSGHIVSDTATTILGNNVVNQGVIGSAGATSVAAVEDVRNISGRIGGDTTSVQAGRDIVNETATLSQTSAASTSGLVGTVTASGQQATGTISSTSGTALVAGRDVDVNGAAITSGDGVTIAAGRNIDVGSIALTTAQNVGTADGLNGGHDSVTQQVGSTITSGGNVISLSGGDTTLSNATVKAGGNVTLLAANNLTVTAANDTHTHSEQSLGGSQANYKNSSNDEAAQGSSLNAANTLTLGAGQAATVATLLASDNVKVAADAPSGGGNLTVLGSAVTTGGTASDGTTSAGGAVTLAATGDMTIGAATETHDAQTWSKQNHSGFMSSDKTTDQTTSHVVTAVGSTVSGDTVSGNAGHDLTVVGSTVASTNDMSLAAGHDLTITTSQDTSDSSHFHEEVTTGLGGTGGAGLSYGTKDTKETTHDNVVTQNGSLVGSTAGSVTMKAGNNLHITGSDVIAAKDITGTGANVTIDAATGTNHHDDTQETKTSGLTLGLGGSVGDAINSAVQQAQAAASGAGDDRAKALHGIAVAGDAVSAVAGGQAVAAGARGPNAPSISVQLSYGTSQSKNTFTEDQTTQTGSDVKAGGTALFAATGGGDNASVPGNGNLTIAGSDVTGNDIALTAKNQVNLVNSTDTDSTRSTNKSSSASVGVSYGTQGWGVSASMSNAHGDANSDAAMQNNTHVTAANNVSIVSGGDTNVIGSDVSGKQVLADVGGNLNVVSVQDTTKSASHQSSTSGGFSISQGGGSASFSATHGDASSNYAAVNEQAGIQAGSGGYDINVKGNTNLTGAYIASTADASKNALTTGTLTVSDIENHSDYSASSSGLSAGGGVKSTGTSTGTGSVSNSGGVSPMLAQHDSGSDNAATRSGISAGTITVTDAANQTQDVASINRDTTGLNGSVSKSADVNGLLASQADSMNAAQAAGQTVAQAVGDYADAKRKAALEDAKQASNNNDPDGAAAALAQADQWSEGGTDRALLHMAGGALVAGLGGGSALDGAVGAGVSAKLAGELNNISKGIGSETGSPLVGNIASNVLAGAAGALVGGSAGAFTASNADLYNRQLHPDEKAAIHAAANGDPVEEKKLTEAACVAVQCWTQYSPTSDEWATHYVSPEEAAQLGPETQWVQSQASSSGLFDYTFGQRVTDNISSQTDSVTRGAGELASQFAYAIKQAAGQGSTPDVDPLTAAMDGNDPPSGTAGATVGSIPAMVLCVPGEACSVTLPVVSPGMPGYVPTNAIFNSGTSSDRPSPRQSEVDVGSDLGDGHEPQVSYKDGTQVPYGTTGSVRPDFVAADGTASFEVKNYNIATNSNGLMTNVAQQAVQRQANLPEGMQQQVIIDTRGQTVTDAQKISLVQGIVQKSNGIISPTSIRFK